MRQVAPVYYPALTGLRMVAACLVFIAHHSYIVPAEAPVLVRQLVEGTYVGVSLFFVLSGYLIARQYFYQPFHSIADYLRYLGVRAARIFPLYWLILFGLYLRWLFALPELVLHATLLKGFFARYQLAGVVQAWTLTTELTFYVLAPFLFRLIRGRSLAWTWGATLLTGILLAGLGKGLDHWASNPAGFLPDLKNMAWFTFFGRSAEFFAGIYLFRFLSQRPPVALKAPGLLPLTYTGGLLFLVVYVGLHLLATPTQPAVASWAGLLLHHLLLPVSIWLILYGLIVEETWLGKMLAQPLLVAMGNASYVFYLIHLGWIRNWTVNHLTASVPLLFLLMWTLALVLHYSLERPLYQWLKRRISGLRS
jgi:peptidoglycan/LPS O-acetylase OafA/YrhL